jgi:small redox-active disulfide protein 2
MQINIHTESDEGLNHMKKLQVYGTGCPKCKQLAQVAEDAAKELGIDYELVKVTDINEIVAAGIMGTPALSVDGEVKVAGKVPSIAEMKSLIG